MGIGAARDYSLNEKSKQKKKSTRRGIWCACAIKLRMHTQNRRRRRLTSSAALLAINHAARAAARAVAVERVVIGGPLATLDAREALRHALLWLLAVGSRAVVAGRRRGRRRPLDAREPLRHRLLIAGGVGGRAGGGVAAPPARRAASAASCLSIAFIREGISWLGEHRPSGGVEATGGNHRAGAIICIRCSAAAASWACCLSRAARIAS